MLGLIMTASLGAVVVLTVSEAKAFEWFREWVSRWPFLHGAVSCRYCFSHWVAALLLMITDVHLELFDVRIVDILINWGALVWLINIFVGILVKANE